MEIKETSAMTEASGLTHEQSSIEQTFEARWQSLQPPSQEAVIRWVDRLREMTVKAPFQSLFVAFLLGIWVARRR